MQKLAALNVNLPAENKETLTADYVRVLNRFIESNSFAGGIAILDHAAKLRDIVAGGDLVAMQQDRIFKGLI